MRRVLYADMFNVFKNKIFQGSIALTVLYPLMEALLFKLIYRFIDAELPGEDVITAYSSIASIVITATIIFLLVNDFSDGAIRNKIINGVKRNHIALSSILTGAIISGLMCMSTCISQTIVIRFLSTGFSSLNPRDVSLYYTAQFAVSIAVGVLMSSIVIVFGGTIIPYFLGLVIAFLFRVANLMVTDKLYPQDGHVMITGMRLLIYNIYDRFCPFSYFTGTLNHPLKDCFIGCGVLIAISILITLPVFKRKELK